MVAPQDSLPVLQVDEAHFAYERKDGSRSLRYAIPAGPGILIAAHGYEFDDPPGLGQTAPNMIRVIKSNGQQFQCTWRGTEHVHELSHATLQAFRADGPFTGFSAGDSAMILIGVHQPGDGANSGGKMSAVWIGLVDVS